MKNPPEHRKLSLLRWTDEHKPVLLLFLAGLLLRFLMMPWAMHADLLSMYWRAHLITEYGLFGLPTNQILGHYIYAANLWVMQLFGADLQGLFHIPFGLSVGSMTASVGDWLRFTEHPYIHQHLFLLKLPHLIFDSGCFWLIWMILRTREHSWRYLALWWLNPVTLFAFYLFSRHDAITSFFMLLTAVFAVRHKYLLWSALSLFAAIQIRVQPLLYVPLFGIAWWRNRPPFSNTIRQVATGVISMALFLGLVQQLPHDSSLYSELMGIERGDITSSPRALGIPRHAEQVAAGTLFGIPIFYVLYSVLLTAMFLLKKISLKQVTIIWFATLAVYFAVNPFSPHYFVWLAAPAVLVALYDKRAAGLYVLAVISWGIGAIMRTDQYAITQHLFVPMGYEFFLLPFLADALDARGGIGGWLSQDIVRLSDLVFTGSLWVAAGSALWQLRSEFTAGARYYFKSIAVYFRIFGILISLATLQLTQSRAHAALLPLESNMPHVVDKIALEPGVVVSQILSAPDKAVGAVGIRFNTYRSIEQRQLHFAIKQLNAQDWWYQNTYDVSDFYNGHFYLFGFPELTLPAGTPLYIEIFADESVSSADGRPALAVMLTQQQSNDVTLLINGQSMADKQLSLWLGSESPSSEAFSRVATKFVKSMDTQQVFFRVYLSTIIFTSAAILLVIVAGHRVSHKKKQA